MKLKYYLRGLGLGIILTSLILVISRNINGGMSDKEIIKRAEALGMVMSTEDSLFDNPDGETTTSDDKETTTDESENGTTQEQSSEDGETEESSKGENTTTESVTDESEEVTTEETSSQEETQTSSTQESETASKSETETTSPQEEETTEENTTEAETPTVKTVVINITKGMRCMEVANILYKEGIIDDAEDFNQYMRQHGYTQEILIGTYTLNSSMTFDEIADIIVRKF